MHINLAYIAAALLLLAAAFWRDYTIRQQERMAQRDCVKELLAQFLGHYPYNQRRMLPLRTYLTVEMMAKYERMRLNGYQPIAIQFEIQRDANIFLKDKMQFSQPPDSIEQS